MDKRKLTTMELMKERRRKRRALNSSSRTARRRPLGLRATANSEELEPSVKSAGIAAVSTMLNLKDRTSFILPKVHYDKAMKDDITNFAPTINMQGLYPRCKFLTFTFKEPPLDWGLKTKLVCTSESTFEWARMIGGSKKAEAIEAVQSNEVFDLANGGMDPAVGLSYSLLQ